MNAVIQVAGKIELMFEELFLPKEKIARAQAYSALTPNVLKIRF